MKPGLYETLERIAAVIESRKGGDAGKSYVAGLLADDEDAVLKKIGEEAVETVLARRAATGCTWCARPRTCGSTA